MKKWNDIRPGDIIRAFTRGEERSVTGTVTRKEEAPADDPGGYKTLYLDVDGMEYAFGTGGHLGDTWTTESGMEEWFIE